MGNGERKARGDRKDAYRVKTLPMNALMPYLMPRRTDSVVYFDIKVNMDYAMALVGQLNESGKYPCKVTYMHLLLATLVKIFTTRPHLNSYVMNNRLYKRKHIDVALTIKKQLTEDAKETTSKIRFDNCKCFEDVVAATCKEVNAAKSKTATDTDKVFELFAGLPRFVLKAAVGFLRFLDAIDKFPKDLYDADPMHCSVFVSNLGSIGLGAPFHHLYEWGNCSIFAAMGKIEKEPIVDQNGCLAIGNVSHIIVTIDERIAEGIKFAKDLELFKTYMENPSLLLTKEESFSNVN